METLPNMMMAPNYQQILEQPQVNGALLQYLSDIKNLQESSQLATSQHLYGDVYSIVLSDQINFYFISNSYVVSVRLEANINISSAKNVFLFRADTDQLGLTGHFALIFGSTNYALVLIDPQYSQPGQDGYKVQWVKNYQTMAQTGGLQGEAFGISFVNMIGEGIQTSKQGFAEQVMVFLLGASAQQKVFQLRVSLRNDTTSGYPLQSVMTSQDEILIYEERRGITSRISNFLSSKLGYKTGDEGDLDSTKCVRDVQNIDSFVVIVTNKDIIIVRRPDMTKVYEVEYLDTLKEFTSRNIDNVQSMRDLLQFNYIASSVCHAESSNQICINLFVKEQQLLQNLQNYQTVKQTRIIQQSRFLTIVENAEISDRDDQMNALNIFDVDRFSKGQEIQKSIAFSYNFFSEQNGSDIISLLFLEFVGGKSIAVEYSMLQKLQNVQNFDFQRIQGIQFVNQVDEDQREQIIRISIASQDDIFVYEYDPALVNFSNVAPASLKQINLVSPEIQQQQSMRASMIPQQIRQVENQIVRMEDLRPFIYRLLDQIASYKYAPATKTIQNLEASRQNQINQIRLDVAKVIPVVTRQALIFEARQILQESIDVQIDDCNFYNRAQDEIRQAFSDDGLILRSLENKEKKIDVILEFLNINDLFDDSIDSEFRKIINNFQFNIYVAKLFKEYQEQIKVRHQQRSLGTSQNIAVKSTDYSLEMRIVSRVLQLTADKLGFNSQKLQQMGATTPNIVYAHVSRFDLVLESLIGISLDTNIQQSIHLAPQEDVYSVFTVVGQMIDGFFRQFQASQSIYSLPETFLSEKTILNDVFKLLDRAKDGCTEQRNDLRQVFSSLSESFIELASFADIENSDPELFNFWKNNIVIYLEEGLGQVRALEYARKYQSRDLLCRLVFDLGSQYFQVLHECIEEWNGDFLQSAMYNIYQQEKSVVQRRRQGQDLGEPYRGFVMFDIFEERYYDVLASFLASQNVKLLTLLQLRHQQAEQANQLMRNEVLPQIEGAQTMKVLSSLAATNIEKCVENISRDQAEENKQFYDIQLNLATTQAQVLPDLDKLAIIDRRFLEQTFATFSQNNPRNVKANLSAVLERLNEGVQNYIRPVNGQQLKELKLVAWRLVAQNDRDQIGQLQQHLADRHIYTEQQIADLVSRTYTYQLGQDFRNTAVFLDPELTQQTLLSEYQDLQESLRIIFQHLRVSDPNLFTQRTSMSVVGGPNQSFQNQSAFYND